MKEITTDLCKFSFRHKARNMQEKTLFEEIRNGNIEMFGILFKKYFGSMCVIAKSFISDTQAAEDIVQDIFIRLFSQE